MDNFIVWAKDFVAHESTVVDIRSLGVESTLKSLMLQNKAGQWAEFRWQVEALPYDMENTGYFKEVINELGVKVAHYDGFVTITNGGGGQHLIAELKGR